MKSPFNRSRSKLLRLLLGLALWNCHCICIGQSIGTASTVKTNFDKGPKLSDAEVATALRLAQTAGTTNVSEIKSYYVHPSPEVGITVNGVETVSNRQVLYVSIEIATEGLADEVIRKPTKIPISEGRYWVRGIRTNTFTLFESKGRTIRVRLMDKIPIERADALIAALAGGKVRYADGKALDGGRNIDLTRPNGMFLMRDGKLRIGFSCGDWCSVSFQCDVDEDGIVLSDPIRIVS